VVIILSKLLEKCLEVRLTEFCEISIKEIENYLKTYFKLNPSASGYVSLWLTGGLMVIGGRVKKKTNRYGITNIYLDREIKDVYNRPMMMLHIHFFKAIVSFVIINNRITGVHTHTQIIENPEYGGGLRGDEAEKSKISIKHLLSMPDISLSFYKFKKDETD